MAGLDGYGLKTVTWEAADEPLAGCLVASPADAEGRGIALTVKCDGAAVDLTGASVYLLWRHQATRARGCEPFEAVDASAGSFRVYWPSAMAAHEGVVDAQVMVSLDDGTAIGSRTFSVGVEQELVTEPGEGGSDGFSPIATVAQTFGLERTSRGVVLGIEIEDDALPPKVRNRCHGHDDRHGAARAEGRQGRPRRAGCGRCRWHRRAGRGFLLISLLEGDAQSLAAAFVFIGFTAFDVITWLALAHASNRLGISAIKTFGFGCAVHFLGMTTGALIAGVVIQPNGAFADFFAPVSLAFAFALVVASTLILTERNLFLSGKETRSKDSPEEQPEGPSPAPSSDIEQRCDAIARTFGLTQREKDVLALLAKGRDTVRIQAELNVSNHTIRSHVYHIYQKLGIHSRQDLIDLIEETEPN